MYAIAACAVAVTGSAASLLPGEALCGSQCETLSLPNDLTDDAVARQAPLWPQRLPLDAGRAFLGDYFPALVPDEIIHPDDDAPPAGRAIPDR